MTSGQAIQRFRENVKSVFDLLDFDRLVLSHAVGSLRTLADELATDGSNNASRRVSNCLQALKRVQSNDSMRTQYETIHSQCVVLLVSYFGSAIHTVFAHAIAEAFDGEHEVPARAQEIKVTWRDLRRDDVSRGEAIAELVVAHRDISFQDMQSIARAFKDALDVDLNRDAVTNDIVLGQACRHVIAHAGRVADARMTRQLRSAVPRSLKLDLKQGDITAFTPVEVRQLASQMETYLSRLVEAVQWGQKAQSQLNG